MSSHASIHPPSILFEYRLTGHITTSDSTHNQRLSELLTILAAATQYGIHFQSSCTSPTSPNTHQSGRDHHIGASPRMILTSTRRHKRLGICQMVPPLIMWPRRQCITSFRYTFEERWLTGTGDVEEAPLHDPCGDPSIVSAWRLGGRGLNLLFFSYLAIMNS